MPRALMRQLVALLVLTAVLFQSHPAHAVFGIGDVTFDPSNWFENMTQVLNTAEMIKNQLMDLHALVVFPITNIARDFIQMTALVNEIKSIMGLDKDGVNQLFGGGMFGVVPCTESDLVAWLASGNSTMRQVYKGSMLAQTLVEDIFALLDCITSIIDQIMSSLGNLQALQTIAQIQSVVVHQQARMMAMSAAFQSALSTGELFRLVQAEAQRCIAQSRMRSIPRANVYGLQVGR